MLELVPDLLAGVLGTLLVEYTAFWCYVIVAVLIERRRRSRA